MAYWKATMNLRHVPGIDHEPLSGLFVQQQWISDEGETEWRDIPIVPSREQKE